MISDIHGCLAPLRKMIEIIEPTPEDHLIFVGDYVDRGPDSKGVIDFLIGIKKKYNSTFLHGNHEEKFLLSHLDKTDLAHWLEAWGGGATLKSYGPMGLWASKLFPNLTGTLSVTPSPTTKLIHTSLSTLTLNMISPFQSNIPSPSFIKNSVTLSLTNPARL